MQKVDNYKKSFDSEREKRRKNIINCVKGKYKKYLSSKGAYLSLSLSLPLSLSLSFIVVLVKLASLIGAVNQENWSLSTKLRLECFAIAE